MDIASNLYTKNQNTIMELELTCSVISFLCSSYADIVDRLFFFLSRWPV